MRLSPMARGRIRLGRPLARFILARLTLRRWLARSRAAPVDGQVLDQELAAVLRLDDFSGDSDLRGLEPERARARVAGSVEIADERPALVADVEELEVGGASGTLSARRYAPPGAPSSSPGLVYLHGGGWVTGDLDTHDGFCRRLAVRGNLCVVSVDYRRAPEHRFPAAADDSVAAFRWVCASAGRLGMDASRVGVAGDSAGGNLSMVVALRTRDDAARPAVAALLYPALDATRSLPSHGIFAERHFLTRPMVEWYYDHYLGDDPAVAHHVEASPLFAERLAGLSPLLVYAAHFDPLRDEAIELARRVTEAGGEVRLRCFETLTHGFALMTGVCAQARAASDAVAVEIGEALRRGGV